MKTYIKKEVVINKEEVARNIVTSQLDICEKLNSKLEELQKKYNSLYLELETLNKKEKSIKKDFIEINKVKTMLNISLIKIEEKEKHDRNIEPIIEQFKQTIHESKKNITKRCKDITAKEKDLLIKEFLIHYITTNKAKLRKEIYGKNRSLETNNSNSISYNNSKAKRTISTTISAKVSVKPVNNSKINKKNTKIDSEIINESINNETIKKKIEFGSLSNNDSIVLKKPTSRLENKSINKELDNSKISADLNKSKIIDNIKFSDRNDDIILMKNNDNSKISKPKKSKHKPLNERILIRNQSMIISHVNSITLYKIIYMKEKSEVLNTTIKSIEESFKVDNRIDSENNFFKKQSDSKKYQIIENNAREINEKPIKYQNNSITNSSDIEKNIIKRIFNPTVQNNDFQNEDLAKENIKESNTKEKNKKDNVVNNQMSDNNVNNFKPEVKNNLLEEKKLNDLRKKSASALVENVLGKISLNIIHKNEIKSSEIVEKKVSKPPEIDFKNIPINLKFEKVLDEATVVKIKIMISEILDKASRVTKDNYLIHKQEEKERRSVLKQGSTEFKAKKSLTITFDESKVNKQETVPNSQKIHEEVKNIEISKKEEPILTDKRVNMRRVSNSKSCKELNKILTNNELLDDDNEDEDKNQIEEFETVTKKIKVKKTVKKIVKKKSVEDKAYKTVVSSILLKNKDENFEKIRIDSSDDENSPKKNLKKGTVCYTKTEINDFNFEEKFNLITKKNQQETSEKKINSNEMSVDKNNKNDSIQDDKLTVNKTKANEKAKELLLKEKNTIPEINNSSFIDASMQKNTELNVKVNNFNEKILNSKENDKTDSKIQISDVIKDKDASRENVNAELYVSSEGSQDNEDYELISDKLKKMVEESNALDKNVRMVSDNISNMISSNHNSIHNSINV